MKKNLLALVAIVAAITLSSFTTQRFTSYYLKYNVSAAGDQRVVASYSEIQEEIFDYEGTQTGAQVLNWIRVEDANSSATIQNSEVLTAFSLYNTGANTTLNDEVDNLGNLDIKDL